MTKTKKAGVMNTSASGGVMASASGGAGDAPSKTTTPVDGGRNLSYKDAVSGKKR